MIKYKVSLYMIAISLLCSASFAETIYCPTGIDGVINNYDDQWKLSATYELCTKYKLCDNITSPFKPPFTLEKVPLQLGQNTPNRSVMLKSMNFTFNQGIGIETTVQSFPEEPIRKSIKLICKATRFTAVELGDPGFIYGKYPDHYWDGKITAEKTVTNYSACTILNTVPESFYCN